MLVPDISVVIVNWNLVDELVVCLRSLYDDGFAGQIIVVDNGSVDASVAVVRREFPAVEVVATRANLGFAEGCNRGLAVARGVWVFTLNNDAALVSGAAAELARLASEAPADVGMIQPTLVFKSRPHHINTQGIALTRLGWGVDRGFGALLDARAQPREIFCASAGAALYRRSMLDQVALTSGVFDRSFFMYFEDVDLGWRCRLAGWRAMYEPSVRIEHRFHGSSDRHGAAWLSRQVRQNRVRMILKNGSPRLLARVVPGFVRASAELLRHGHHGPMTQAYRDGWRQRAEVEALATIDRRTLERVWFGR